MTREFWAATAEQVVAVVDAVMAAGRKASPDLVARFANLTKDIAEKALDLATDLGLLTKNGTDYEAASPLCPFFVTPDGDQKAAALRVVVESYEPFIAFRQRMAVVPVTEASEQTRALLDLNQHREDVMGTLLSLGTYSQALVSTGPGKYDAGKLDPNPLEVLADACTDRVSAEVRVREQLGDAAGSVSREDVILPLADSLLKGRHDARGAVVAAGNAVESFLVHEAPGAGVNLANAPGINAKIDKYLDAQKIPKKLGWVGKYVGHVRNAADHGVDTEVGAPWEITPETGLELPFVACSFIRAVARHLRGESPRV